MRLRPEYLPSGQDAVGVASEEVQNPEVRQTLGRILTDVHHEELVFIVEVASDRVDYLRTGEDACALEKVHSALCNLGGHCFTREPLREEYAAHNYIDDKII